MQIFKRIIIGADSAGYHLKEQIKEKLTADGYIVEDMGPDSDASCHYPDANILCFGARVVGYGLACDLVDAFLSSPFEGGRHQTRVDMITKIENGQ